jgi:hypothetical protein
MSVVQETTPPEVQGSGTAEDSRRSKRGTGVRAEGAAERFGLVGAWILEMGVFLVWVPAFRSAGTFQIILGSQSTQIVVTLAVTIVLIGGEFDQCPTCSVPPQAPSSS